MASTETDEGDRELASDDLSERRAIREIEQALALLPVESKQRVIARLLQEASLNTDERRGRK